MKFDIPESAVDQILQIMQTAPVAHNVVDPLLKAFVAQANDKRIQSLEYTDEALFRDAVRWRKLRAHGGWPDTEAAAGGASPEWFDALIDAIEPRLTGESNG